MKSLCIYIFLISGVVLPLYNAVAISIEIIKRIDYESDIILLVPLFFFVCVMAAWSCDYAKRIYFRAAQ